MENKILGGIPEKFHTSYPSRYEIDEIVDLNFLNSIYIKGCRIAAIHFTIDKVKYDIYIPVGIDNEEYTIIEQVDSFFVKDPII